MAEGCVMFTTMLPVVTRKENFDPIEKLKISVSCSLCFVPHILRTSYSQLREWPAISHRNFIILYAFPFPPSSGINDVKYEKTDKERVGIITPS